MAGQADFYIDQLRSQEFLQVRIWDGSDSTAGAFNITGILEHDIQPQLSTEWGNRFQSTIDAFERASDITSFVRGAGQIGKKVLGINPISSFTDADPFTLKTQFLTQLKWTGSNHLIIPLQLTFLSTDKAKTEEEVLKPIAKIMAASYPKGGSTDNLTFTPPLAYDPNTRKGLLSLKIGNWLYINNALILSNPQPVYKKVPDKNGKPTVATIGLTLTTYMVPFAEQVEKWFLGQAADFRELTEQDAGVLLEKARGADKKFLGRALESGVVEIGTWTK